jgi:hypothetical protein
VKAASAINPQASSYPTAGAFGSSILVRIVPSLNMREKVFNNEIRYLAAQPLAASEVRAEMHASENPA